VSTELTLDLPLAQVNNSNQRKHWTKTAANRSLMRTIAGLEARDLTPVTGPVHLWVVFTFPDKRQRDLDNFEVKGAIDGIVDAGVLPDDNTRQVVAVTRTVGKGRSEKGRVRIRFVITDQHVPFSEDAA
jgi:crossover junction endodeoxyribonuclease RusA